MLLVLFKQVLAKIHNSANRRIRHRGNFNEVQSLVFGQTNRRGDSHDPCLLTIRAYNPHFGGLDFIVAPYALCNCDTQILPKIKILARPEPHHSGAVTTGTRF